MVALSTNNEHNKTVADNGATPLGEATDIENSADTHEGHGAGGKTVSIATLVGGHGGRDEAGHRMARRRRETFRKGVYLLPNLITSASLFCGFYSMVQTIHGHYVLAAWAILASAVFDAFDGTVARLTNTASDFGVEYDSLADAIAFGVAPALLMFQWALLPYKGWGWAAAFVFAACAVLRLARFNVQVLPDGGKFFAGLPTPGAGGMIATTVLLYHYFGWQAEGSRAIVLLIESFFLGFLMVSSVPYLSSKKLGLTGRVPFWAIVLIPIALAALLQEPEIGLFGILATYTLHGPVMFVLRRGRSTSEDETE